jgi:hypothetical protein
MVTIGNTNIPGTILTVESARSVGVGIQAPGDLAIVGQADLDNGDASANEMVAITRPNQAAKEFGDPENSMLTGAVQDALVEGAYPVFAIPAAETEVNSEDLSGASGSTGTLSNAPIREDASTITFNINSTQKTTVLEYDQDPANVTPDTDEVIVNPVTSKYHSDESLGNSGDDVSYEYFDYENAHETIKTAQTGGETFLRERLDLVATLSENSSVVSDLQTTVSEMEQNGWFAIGLAGAGSPYIADTSTYSNSYDTSRLQLVHPSRKDDYTTALGSYAGHRSDVGITSSPIFDVVETASALQLDLSTSQQENLVNANVNPLEERGGGARIIHDLTTVTDGNTDESSWRQGFARLVTDYVAEQTDAIAQDYVGELNVPAVRNSLRAEVAGMLRGVLEARQITAFSLIVEEDTANSVLVDIGIDTTDPIENIRASVLAGRVDNGTGGDN